MNPLLVVAGVLGGALVLGIVVALVVTFVIRPGRQTDPPVAAGTSGVAPPGTDQPTDRPTEEPTDQSSGPPSPEPPGEPRPDYAQAAAQVVSGVVRVLASTCQADAASAGQGAGVLVADGSVLTAWPVVSQAVSIVVVVGDAIIPATVEGVDRAAGLARLALARSAPKSAHRFELAPASFADDVAALIVPDPYGRDDARLITPRVGEVAAAKFGGRTLELPTVGLDGAPIGGFPRIDGDGALAGMVVGLPGGTWLLAGGDRLTGAVEATAGADPGSCHQAHGPTSLMIMDVGSGASKDPFAAYFAAINSGDYATAYAQLHAPGRSLAETEPGWYSTYDFDIVVHHNDLDTAWVEFVSIFRAGLGPEAGLTCARWSLDYTLVDGRIDKVSGHKGDALYQPC